MGKLILIEGTDCSGKETQSKLLKEKIEKDNKTCVYFSFPNYNSPTGKIVGGPYLGKEEICKSYFTEGAVNVDPKVSCLYFAADRLYNLDTLKNLVNSYDYVILDRYTFSNMAHQGGKEEDKNKRNEWLEREELLIGKENIEKLNNSKVAIFGCGGVGSYTLEALVRAGVGNIVLVDNDIVDITNINRQLIADTTTIGQDKVEIAKQRALKINPNINIETHKVFYDENYNDLIKTRMDYFAEKFNGENYKNKYFWRYFYSEKRKMDYCLEIYMYNNYSRLKLFSREDAKNKWEQDIKDIEAWLKKHKLFEGFKQDEDGCWAKEFKFPKEEDALEEFTGKLIKLLEEDVESISNSGK